VGNRDVLLDIVVEAHSFRTYLLYTLFQKLIDAFPVRSVMVCERVMDVSI